MLQNQSAKIFVDADACPVKAEIRAAAKNFPNQVVFVASYAHHIESLENEWVVQVDPSDQAVDLYIANMIRPHDLLITHDLGLAAVGLAKQAVVLSFRGQLYTDSNIQFLLESRNNQIRRRRGGLKTKGPKAFTQEDRNNFLQLLTQILTSLQEN